MEKTDQTIQEMLDGSEIPRHLQKRLFDAITHIFAKAIDTCSPANRPPGKAGLRAEKGYYRLLYLEGEYQQHVAPNPQAGTAAPFNWHRLTEILKQLRDLPELQQQLTIDIESALRDILLKK